MNTLRKLRSPWVIVTVLLVSYPMSYLSVGEYKRIYHRGVLAQILQDPYVCHRRFNHEWMIGFYRPLADVEEKVRCKRVLLTTYYIGYASD